MLPKTKIGEAQVQQAFIEHLKYKIQIKFGHDFPYNYGAFNGSQDRKYADYFAGVNAQNILVEFKEFESEVSSESKKPLRKKLCETISNDSLSSSLTAHFISWRLENTTENSLELRIDTYLPAVCPLFDIQFKGSNEKKIPEFIDDFLNMKSGVSNEEFESYIDKLSDIAGDDGDTSFYGVHVTFNSEHGIELKIFSTIAELIELSKNLSYSKSISSNNHEQSPEDDEPSPNWRGPTM